MVYDLLQPVPKPDREKAFNEKTEITFMEFMKRLHIEGKWHPLMAKLTYVVILW